MKVITQVIVLSSSLSMLWQNGMAWGEQKSVEEATSFPQDSITCAEGEGEVFSMSLTPVPSAVLSLFSGLKGDFLAISRRKTRLEMCIDFEALKFFPKRLTTWTNEGSAGGWTAIARVLRREGASLSMEQGMTNDDLSLINVEFPNLENPQRSFLLKGWQLSDGTRLVSLSAFDATKGDPLQVAVAKPSVSEVVDVGILEEGDPFSGGAKCYKKSFTMAELNLSYRFCMRGSHGTRITYDFTSISLHDNSPELAEPLHIDLAGVEANFAMSRTSTHHSLNDEFSLSFGESHYKIGYPVQGSDGMALIVKHGKLPERSIKLACLKVYECGSL